MLGTYVDADLAERFAALARQTEGGTSAALRRLITEAVEDKPPGLPRGSGTGAQVGIRLKPAERTLLAKAAYDRGTSPANWVRSLALVHLANQPQWNTAELEGLRDIFGELRRIGANINQIAHAMNIAIETGQYPAYQGGAVREAAGVVRNEMRRTVSIMTGNFAYWGSPYDEVLQPHRGAVEQANAEAQAAERKRKNRPRRRPARFRDND
jgi:hypothetical protein